MPVVVYDGVVGAGDADRAAPEATRPRPLVVVMFRPGADPSE